MNQLTTVFFTGMEALDAEQLTALFQETNRRTGNRWSLAEAMDSADVLVIDVDTLKVTKSIKVGRYPWGVAVKG